MVFHMIKDFFKTNRILVTNTGIVATVAALFLNVNPPENEIAKLALGNLQIFSLFMLMICLIVLSVGFVKVLVRTESGLLKKHKIPRVGALSVTMGFVLVWIILNLAQYIGELYPASFKQFLGITLPGLALMSCFGLMVFVEKYENKFSLFSKIVVYDFLMSAGLIFICMFIQNIFLKYFFFYWTSFVLPVLFIAVLLTSVAVALVRKQKLFR